MARFDGGSTKSNSVELPVVSDEADYDTHVVLMIGSLPEIDHAGVVEVLVLGEEVLVTILLDFKGVETLQVSVGVNGKWRTISRIFVLWGIFDSKPGSRA